MSASKEIVDPLDLNRGYYQITGLTSKIIELTEQLSSLSRSSKPDLALSVMVKCLQYPMYESPVLPDHSILAKHSDMSCEATVSQFSIAVKAVSRSMQNLKG